MENRGLLFIPDISGFTSFVNQTEISHSRLIIQELLELLINTNQIGLEVSEVEGDAILFYKFGEVPDLRELYNQVEKMFVGFHKHLLAYDYRKYCQCKACMSAINLSLKIITHYGEFTGYSVKNFNKLIGKDVIVAHQLLKNEIEQHEYWLVTPSLTGQVNPPSGLAHWMKWDMSTKKTDNGEIPFLYTQLSHLKKEITPESFSETFSGELNRKMKVISFSKEYDTDIITLFHASGDFNYRHRWMEGIIRTEEVNHFLPRVGMRCRCILESGEDIIYSSSYSYSPEKIQFSETDERKKGSVYYTLEKINDKRTKITIELYRKKRLGSKMIFNLREKRKTEKLYAKSLRNLEKLVKEIRLPQL